jgi:hypothetical protein
MMSGNLPSTVSTIFAACSWACRCDRTVAACDPMTWALTWTVVFLVNVGAGGGGSAMNAMFCRTIRCRFTSSSAGSSAADRGVSFRGLGRRGLLLPVAGFLPVAGLLVAGFLPLLQYRIVRTDTPNLTAAAAWVAPVSTIHASTSSRSRRRSGVTADLLGTPSSRLAVCVRWRRWRATPPGARRTNRPERRHPETSPGCNRPSWYYRGRS